MTELNYEQNMQQCLAHIESIDKVLREYPDSLDKTFAVLKLKDANLWINNIIVMEMRKAQVKEETKPKIEIVK
jgi:hypothetical protein